MNVFDMRTERKTAMRNATKNNTSSSSIVYESPKIIIVRLPNDIITYSDPNEGEWDVEEQE